jgi:hypothetical protein
MKEQVMKKISPRAHAPAHKVMEQKKYTLGIFPKTEEEWVSLRNDMKNWAHLETSFALEDFPL